MAKNSGLFGNDISPAEFNFLKEMKKRTNPATQVATTLFELYTELLEAGFNDEQAIHLTAQFILRGED